MPNDDFDRDNLEQKSAPFVPRPPVILNNPFDELAQKLVRVAEEGAQRRDNRPLREREATISNPLYPNEKSR